ncbi:MAG: GGDEF domain-containing protein [Anaerolineales bacterium]|nr:GGDEF domain-containing protein [Anaerolineales bacterium]
MMKSVTEIEAHLDKVGKTVQEISGSRPLEALRLCHAAIQEADQVERAPRSLKNQIGRLQMELASLNILLMSYDKALENALEAHAIYIGIGLQSGAARSLNIIGLAHAHLGTYAEALENFQQALNAANQMDDSWLKSRVLNNLGFLYLRMEDFSRALDYLNQSYSLMTNGKTTQVEASLLENLSIAYLNLGEYEKALNFGQQSIQQYQGDNNPRGEATALNRVGEIYFLMGLADQALTHFQDSLEICEGIEYHPGAAQAHTLIGELAFQQGKNSTALRELLQALDYSEDGLNQKRVSEVHFLVSQVYQQSGSYKEALAHFKQYHKIKEAVFDQDIATRIKSLELIHRLQETQQDREEFRLENAALLREIEERTKIQAELERMVTLDPLTELKNRRHFFELIRQEMNRSRRYNQPLSLIMLDIDHFKSVNDEFGHLVGDRVIVEVAKKINKTLRRVDVACRYGGEEFAVLLPETPLNQAVMVADRLWRIISKQPTVSSELKISITVSIGVASLEKGEIMSPDALLDRADQALYIAKKNGRNQVAAYNNSLKAK